MKIEEAKDRLSIPALAAQLFPDWKPAKCCRRPWGKTITLPFPSSMTASGGRITRQANVGTLWTFWLGLSGSRRKTA